MQRSILIYSTSDELVRKLEQPLQNLGFFTLFGQAELPTRKILHDIAVSVVLFDIGSDLDGSLKLLHKLRSSHDRTPFILLFDGEKSKELADLNLPMVGFYNKDAPLIELLVEITRVFPSSRQALLR